MQVPPEATRTGVPFRSRGGEAVNGYVLGQRWNMIRRPLLSAACALGVLCVSLGCASTEGKRDFKTPALAYQLKELKEPRPSRIHILRVDFSQGRTEPAVVIAPDPDGDGAAEAALTSPLTLAEGRSVLAFINTNPWDSLPDSAGNKNRKWYEGQPVDIHGLAASEGHTRSAADRRVAVWVDADGRVSVGQAPTDGSLTEGMGGFAEIVREGAVVVPPGGAIHPRTAIGVDQGGRVMWLVVVDGRQKNFSEGMSVEELGCVMRDLGCWAAANMDGGGSSIMGLAGSDGRLRVVNSPSDRAMGVLPKIRPLPMILTIRKRSDRPGAE